MSKQMADCRYCVNADDCQHIVAPDDCEDFEETFEHHWEKMDDIERQLHEKCKELPNAENVLEIKGIGENILAGILAEMGDISRFDDVKEIQKISGLGLVACSSGKHKGETRISHRGRKRLRYWLFQAGVRTKTWTSLGLQKGAEYVFKRTA